MLRIATLLRGNDGALPSDLVRLGCGREGPGAAPPFSFLACAAFKRLLRVRVARFQSSELSLIIGRGLGVICR